ncbi:MAG TPA: hypothetical protein VF300_00090 [Methanothrix sp.]
MLESLERKNRRLDMPYDLEEPEDITKSLMKLSELSLHDFLAGEPDIYTVRDLKVRYR